MANRHPLRRKAPGVRSASTPDSAVTNTSGPKPVSSNMGGHGNAMGSGTPDGPGNGGASGSGMSAPRGGRGVGEI